MKKSGGGKRGFLRIPFRTEVEITCGDKVVRTETNVDISMSGVRIPLNGSENLEPGAACRVSVILNVFENPISIEAVGNITRSDPAGVAVQYTELDADSYSHLRQLILNNAEDTEQAEREFEAHWGIKRRGGISKS